MIRHLWVKNFGPFESASVDLDPFTVFLGPNGSGKSLLFWAIRGLGRITRFSLRAPRSQPKGSGFPTRTGQVAFADIIHRKDPNRTVVLGAEFQTPDGGGSYEVHLSRRRFPGGAIIEEHLKWASSLGNVELHATDQAADSSVSIGNMAVPRQESAPYRLFRADATHEIGKAIQAALWDRTAVYRFDPSALKSPSEIGTRFSTTGNGFASYLDQIRNEPGGQQAFEALVRSVLEICPHLKDVLLPVDERGDEEAAAPRKRLALIMSEPGELIPVELESDGTILMLAYAALMHGSQDLDTVCIEEPENGIHPKVIPYQVKMLRQLSNPQDDHRPIQVLVATHSRAFFDEIKSYGELRLVKRGRDGRSSVERPPDSVHPALAGWAGLA
jgi:predicted ATPase